MLKSMVELPEFSFNAMFNITEDDLRPFSLTSQIAKVMEGCTSDNLFPEVANKMDTKQFVLPKELKTHALAYLLYLILVAL